MRPALLFGKGAGAAFRREVPMYDVHVADLSFSLWRLVERHAKREVCGQMQVRPMARLVDLKRRVAVVSKDQLRVIPLVAGLLAVIVGPMWVDAQLREAEERAELRQQLEGLSVKYGHLTEKPVELSPLSIGFSDGFIMAVPVIFPKSAFRQCMPRIDVPELAVLGKTGLEWTGAWIPYGVS